MSREAAEVNREFKSLVEGKAGLPSCENKEAVDNWSIRFCQANNKQLRLRLVIIPYALT